MPWDSDGSAGTTAKPNTTTTPSGGNSNIVTGEFVSGRNLTLYGSYFEDDYGRIYYGFSANGLKPHTNYRVRITFPCRDPFECDVMYDQGDGGWHEYVGYKSPGVTGHGIYDSDTREVSADFVIRTGSDGSVRFMLKSPEGVYGGEDKYQKTQARADSAISGYSVSLTQTDAGISECLCHPEAVG